jgi:16S rRNA (cytosine1402-N4)-methyltransferase
VEEICHIPVLLHEVIEYLRCEKDKAYLDCTLGAGGHAEAIAQISGAGGKIVGIDRDEQALALARRRLSVFGDCITFIQGNFAEVDKLLSHSSVQMFDGILADLGFSSVQIDDGGRGFSFMRDGILDMRMDRTQSLTAGTIINQWSEDELGRIIRDYGEERWWKRISHAIVAARIRKPVETTAELRGIIETAVPHKARKRGIHPATRVFQSIRIAVNEELDSLEKALPALLERLKEGARLAVISYHSLEDRIVKQFFLRNAKGCICPPEIPVCRCGRKPTLKIVTRKVITPTQEEIEKNPRARSAKMRVCESLGKEAPGREMIKS